MIKLFNQSVGRLRRTKTKSIIQASLIGGTLIALLSFAGEALGQPVQSSNPFVILLDGIYAPAVNVPNLGLSQVTLNDGSYSKVAIYNLASGFPGPTDKAIGNFYVAIGNAKFVAYDLPEGAFTAQFVGRDAVRTNDVDGSWTLRGTFELEILEATGIYRSFVGGKIHMVDVLKFRSGDGTFLEHCFCYFSPPLLVTLRVSQVEVGWNSESNLTYQVQYRSDLTTNLWTSLGDRVRSTGSKSFINDPVVVGQPQRFYRVVLTNSVPAL